MISGVTRGGWGGQVAHPWKVWGKFWFCKEGGKEKKGKGEEKEEERAKRVKEKGGMENAEEKKGNCKRGGGKLSLFETTKICLGCTKMEISTRKKSISGRE